MLCLNERANSSARKASRDGKLESKGGWIYRKFDYQSFEDKKEFLHGEENEDDDEKTSNDHPEGTVSFITGE